MNEKTQWIEHMYTDNDLQWYIWRFNDILNLLTVTGEFDADDKIVNVERWLLNDKWEWVYWDYLDFPHVALKWKLVDDKEYEDLLHCIKFTLQSGKVFILSEDDKKDLPSWIHGLWEYIKDLSEAKRWNMNYAEMIQLILQDISSHEYEYFHSDEYQKQRQEVWHKLLDILKAEKVDNL